MADQDDRGGIAQSLTRPSTLYPTSKKGEQ